MVFSENQVRHLYVANALKEDKTKLTAVGDFFIGSTNEFQKELYFMIKGPDTVLKSDFIPLNSITSIRTLSTDNMASVLKSVNVTLDANVNEGKPIAGQDYILRINLRQFYGMSDQDQYFKDAAVHATKGMTASDFYTAMKKSLDMCFSREVGATPTSNPYLEFTASAAGLKIKAKEQPWELGVEASEDVYFEVVPTTVYDGVDDLIWGKVEKDSTNYVASNGTKKLADLEYFLLGERGDQYRKIGWPNDIETKGMVNPSHDYNIIDIHYSFSDTGVNSYKTEKDVTLAVDATNPNLIDDVIKKLNEVGGLNIKLINNPE